MLGHSFTIHTDHKSLKELISQIIQTPEQQVYLSKLLVVADAVSRIEQPAACHTLSMPHFIFLDNLRESLRSSSAFNTLAHNIQTHPSSHQEYKVSQGLIFFKDNIWIDPTSDFKTRLLQEFQKSPLAGHMGALKTFHRFHDNFSVQECAKMFKNLSLNVQYAKSSNMRPNDLLGRSFP